VTVGGVVTTIKVTRKPMPVYDAAVKSLGTIFSPARTDTCAVSTEGRVLCVQGSGVVSELVGVSGVTDVGVSDANFRCALMEDRTVKCWGMSGAYAGGNLGAGDGADSDMPVSVRVATGTNRLDVGGVLSNVTQISVGYNHTCAVVNGDTANGDLYCWGRMADTFSYASWAATKVPGLSGVKKVAAGRFQTCATTTSQTYCWGDNDWTQQSVDYLNVGSVISQSTPTAVKGPGGAGTMGAVDEIASGLKNTCVVKNGMQFCWGFGMNGIPAYEQYAVAVKALTATVTGTNAILTGVVQTAPSLENGCARTSDGHVWCSGNTTYYAAGNGEAVGFTGSWGMYVPRMMSVISPSVFGLPNGGRMSDVVDIVTMYNRTCALTGSGEVYCWGEWPKTQFSKYIIRQPTLVIGPSTPLSALAISPGTLNPTFVSSTLQYAATVPNGTNAVTVTATAAKAGASLAYASTAGACTGGNCPVTAIGTTALTVTVTAANGLVREYVILVTVAPAGASSDAGLASLDVMSGTMTPSYVSTTLAYAVDAPAGTTLERVFFEKVQNEQTVTFASTAGACTGTYGNDCSIAASGTTTITVTVTAADGVTKQEYVLVVTVALPGASSDAMLSALAIAPGTLKPAFVSGTTEYSAMVPDGTTSMAVTATVNNSGAVTSYASTAGACTGATCPIASSGTTTITVTVTAADGVTKQEYVLVVTVAPPGASSDAALGDLAIAPGTLKPAFVSSTTSYAAAMPNGTTTAAVTATANDVSATVAVASTAGSCTPGNASPSDCALAASGTTTITITITAPDLTITKVYTIVVTVAAPLATIGVVWPNIGVPAGGMPVTLFGSGFSVATAVRVSNSIANVSVPFTPTGDTRIDFVMPAGEDGTTADITVETESGSQTAAQAFRYVAPIRVEVDGNTGAEITTVNGIVIVIPPQGVSGTLVITMTPAPPESSVPGTVLMHSFRLDALLNGETLATLANPVTITLPVDPGVVPNGEQPWLYRWTMTAGKWSLVPGQNYEAGQVRVTSRPMGLYALSTAILRSYWLPVVPMLR
jgi:hypothetical protein